MRKTVGLSHEVSTKVSMVFGLGSTKKEDASKDAKSSKSAKKASGSNADEAAELLKKMQDKKDGGECPFC